MLSSISKAGFCLPLLALPWTGCGGGPAPGPGGPSFRELGEESILEVLSPESYLVAECRYSLPEGLEGTLALDVLIADSPEDARRDLARVLSEIERLRGEAAGSAAVAVPPGEDPTERVYELAVRSRWILDLELSDSGGEEIGIRARPAGRQVQGRVPAPDLLGYLRQVSFRALRGSMARPRRARTWHFAALADYLSTEGSSGRYFLPEGEQESLRREILRALESDAERSRLARALVSRVGLFSEEELESFRGADEISLRVLVLTRTTLSGDRKALGELVTLSLEYFAQARLFAVALKKVFPVQLNSDLYRMYPGFWTSEVKSLAVIQEVRGRLASAKYREAVGWTLGEES